MDKDPLSNKIATPNLSDPVDLKTMLNNMQNVIPKYFSLSSDPNSNIMSLFDFL